MCTSVIPQKKNIDMCGGASSIPFLCASLLDDFEESDVTAPPLLNEGVSNKRNLLLGISGAIGETFILSG